MDWKPHFTWIHVKPFKLSTYCFGLGSKQLQKLIVDLKGQRVPLLCCKMLNLKHSLLSSHKSYSVFYISVQLLIQWNPLKAMPPPSFSILRAIHPLSLQSPSASFCSPFQCLIFLLIFTLSFLPLIFSGPASLKDEAWLKSRTSILSASQLFPSSTLFFSHFLSLMTCFDSL